MWSSSGISISAEFIDVAPSRKRAEVWSLTLEAGREASRAVGDTSMFDLPLPNHPTAYARLVPPHFRLGDADPNHPFALTLSRRAPADLRVLTAMYPTAGMFVVRADSPYRTIADLRGKPI
eukprot:gene53850-71963_t